MSPSDAREAMRSHVHEHLRSLVDGPLTQLEDGRWRIQAGNWTLILAASGTSVWAVERQGLARKVAHLFMAGEAVGPAQWARSDEWKQPK